MNIEALLIAVVVVSLVIWLVQSYVPQPGKTIITVVLVLVVCIVLLDKFAAPLLGHGKL
jgi:hypothetical protein